MKLNRRQVLKSAAIAAAALTVQQSAHAAGSDTIRIGMVGCGGRCTGAAGEALIADPGTRLVAMADLFADRVQGKRQGFINKTISNDAAKPAQLAKDRIAVDDDHCFVGLDGYKKVIDSVDVVLIACAAKFHPMYVKAAIDAGKHVFCEKPHGIDPYGMKVLAQAVQTAKEKKLGFLSGLQSRFHNSIKETMQRVIDGQIGEIVAIEENFIRGPYGGTTRNAQIREIENQYGNQYRFSWLCGDDVTQSLVHNIDRATWAMKETAPVKCHGLGGRSGSQILLGDVFDHHSVVYEYANGTKMYAICRTNNGCYNENSSIIMGSKGKAYPLAGRITGDNAWKYAGAKGDESPYVAEHRAFLKSIREGNPLNCGSYAVMSTTVCIMGQMSCYSGKEVTWKQITDSNYHIPPKPEDCTWEMEAPTKPDQNGSYPVCAIPGSTKNV